MSISRPTDLGENGTLLFHPTALSHSSASPSTEQMAATKSLDELAAEAILSESKRRKCMEKEFGTSAWISKPSSQRINKTFVNNMVGNSLHSNKRKPFSAPTTCNSPGLSNCKKSKKARYYSVTDPKSNDIEQSSSKIRPKEKKHKKKHKKSKSKS